MIVGLACRGFEHAADAHAAGQVHVLADLRARAHGGPGVDHGAFVDIGADVHVAGHQHHARPMKLPRRATAGGTTRMPVARIASSLTWANLVCTLSK